MDNRILDQIGQRLGQHLGISPGEDSRFDIINQQVFSVVGNGPIGLNQTPNQLA